MREMSTWFYRTLAGSGYPGLSYHWDMILRTLEFPGRALLPAASHHTYFAHPQAIPSQKQCVVSGFSGGNSVNSIAADGHFKVSLKAVDDKELSALKQKVQAAVKKGVEAENAFRGVKAGDLTRGVPAEVRYSIK